MNSDEPLIELIFDLLARSSLPSDVSDLVLAALSGDRELGEALAGRPASLAEPATPAGGPSAHVYLSSVSVSGFRGVGPGRTLRIPDGPGLTLVVGRNGSGKSSFAEAIELALTGDSARWADKNSVWRTGWRNLHQPSPCDISVELRIDGCAWPVVVRRAWPGDADLDAAEATVTGAGSTANGSGGRTDLTSLGLARPLALYRPFLTAAELGNLVSGTPSRLFDALNAILGLDALTDADKRLREAAKPLDTHVKETPARRLTLRDELLHITDDRARRAAATLSATAPDLDLLAGILAEPVDDTTDATRAACRALAALPRLDAADATAAADRLRVAADQVRRHDAAAARAQAGTVRLLREALAHHTETGDGPCPVCGVGTLDGDWRTNAAATLDDLQRRTEEAERAARRHDEALRRARTLIEGCATDRPEPTGAPTVAAALLKLRTAVAELIATPTGSRPVADTTIPHPLTGRVGQHAPDEPPAAPAYSHALADHLVRHYPTVVAAVDATRTAAAEWLSERDRGWQEAAEAIRAWLADARRLPEQQRKTAKLKTARGWLKDTGVEIRSERLAPFAAHSQQIWQELRQDSNVALGTMALAGTANRRRVEFPVSVDGADNGTALGVMSQGEMHALGLAAFLPRSCAQESPFRFVIIDDPVQSMDPSKVDGLARVLATLAKDRQVVVFTHDNRLPDAVRRLQVEDFHAIEVVRAEQSVVTLRPAQDPVERYLDDAWALARSAEVPEDTRGPVVAEMCRSAVEAACHRVIWRHRLQRGEQHADIEDTLEGAPTAPVMAMALFDDPKRGGDVLTHLNRRHGRWAADAYQACRKGVHGAAYRGNLPQLVNDTRKLTEALQ